MTAPHIFSVPLVCQKDTSCTEKGTLLYPESISEFSIELERVSSAVDIF